jgi:N6-adenosine-specific RNA methylase IME4
VNDRFRVVLADPAWLFGDKLPGKGRGASKHYGCMPTRDICRMPLPPTDDVALLALWRVSSMQRDALDVIDAWGFTLKTELVWVKTTKLGKRHFGMGRTLRAEHETCLIATRGRFKPKVRNIRTTFTAPVQEHSRKPDEIYAILEALSDGPYVELFARRRREGWTSIGNELPEEQAA